MAWLFGSLGPFCCNESMGRLEAIRFLMEQSLVHVEFIAEQDLSYSLFKGTDRICIEIVSNEQIDFSVFPKLCFLAAIN